MTLGDRIKLLRGAESQEKFAKRIGVNKVTLGNYERDERTPNISIAANICTQCGVSSHWLIFGEGEMRGSTPSVSPPGPPEPTRMDQDGVAASRLAADVRAVSEELRRVNAPNEVVQQAILDIVRHHTSCKPIRGYDASEGGLLAQRVAEDSAPFGKIPRD